MKNLLLFIVVQIFFCSILNAQVGINNQKTIKVEPNTIYQADSENQGVLFPRLSTSQRNALSTNPTEIPNGLIVYDTDLNCLLYWSSGISNQNNGWKGHCEKKVATNTVVQNNSATNTPGDNPIIP